MTSARDTLPDDLDALRVALAAERAARFEAEARASGAEAMVAHLKLLTAKLPRERVVIPGPTACPCCQGPLTKLGEDVTETLELVPRRWKVIQTMRERLACRACQAISQVSAPFHPIARGRAGPELLATVLEAKFGQHLPLNRQSEGFALEGIALDPSTLAD